MLFRIGLKNGLFNIKNYFIFYIFIIIFNILWISFSSILLATYYNEPYNTNGSSPETFLVLNISFICFVFVNIYANLIIDKQNNKEYAIYKINGLKTYKIALIIFIEKFVTYFSAYLISQGISILLINIIYQFTNDYLEVIGYHVRLPLLNPEFIIINFLLFYVFLIVSCVSIIRLKFKNVNTLLLDENVKSVYQSVSNRKLIFHGIMTIIYFIIYYKIINYDFIKLTTWQLAFFTIAFYAGLYNLLIFSALSVKKYKQSRTSRGGINSYIYSSIYENIASNINFIAIISVLIVVIICSAITLSTFKSNDNDIYINYDTQLRVNLDEQNILLNNQVHSAQVINAQYVVNDQNSVLTGYEYFISETNFNKLLSDYELDIDVAKLDNEINVYTNKDKIINNVKLGNNTYNTNIYTTTELDNYSFYVVEDDLYDKYLALNINLTDFESQLDASYTKSTFSHVEEGNKLEYSVSDINSYIKAGKLRNVFRGVQNEELKLGQGYVLSSVYNQTLIDEKYRVDIPQELENIKFENIEIDSEDLIYLLNKEDYDNLDLSKNVIIYDITNFDLKTNSVTKELIDNFFSDYSYGIEYSYETSYYDSSYVFLDNLREQIALLFLMLISLALLFLIIFLRFNVLAKEMKEEVNIINKIGFNKKVINRGIFKIILTYFIVPVILSVLVVAYYISAFNNYTQYYISSYKLEITANWLVLTVLILIYVIIIIVLYNDFKRNVYESED